MADATFPFTWNFTRSDALFAQIDGRAIVSDNGDIELQLENLLSDKFETIGGHLEQEVLTFLRADAAYAQRIRQAESEALAGRIAYDREILRPSISHAA